MMKSILKAFCGGILLGTLAFFATPLFVILLMFGLMMSIFFRIKYGRGGFSEHKLAFASYVRNMNEEEFEAFKNRTNTAQCCCSKACC